MNMMIPELRYGQTPIYRLNADGSVDSFVCSGYAEHEVYDSENKEYRVVSYLYGRNEKCRSACFTVNPLGENHLTSLVGKNVFFSMEEIEAEIERRKREKENEKNAHFAEINKMFGKQTRRRSVK